MDKPNRPKLYLLSRPAIDFDVLEEFISDRNLSWLPTVGASDSEHLVEIGGRICYMSFTNDQSKIRYPNQNYIANLVAKGHESVLEHAAWTFIIDRVSRAFSHQLVRHRVGFAFSQLSQQYHDERGAEFLIPVGLSAAGMKHWDQAIAHAREAYKKILTKLDADEGVSFEEKRKLRSAARSVLPNATMTTLVVTANARAIRHFIIMRGAVIGDIEMRLVSAELLKLVKADSPGLFYDLETKKHEDGWPITSIAEDPR